ncbi:MAG: hypothetical protein HQK76_11550 [Desulfobacterales bacterium]|nr:hypothetical protein [Desulfobacterales bacterium]
MSKDYLIWNKGHDIKLGRFGKVLIKSGIINEEQLNNVLAIQKQEEASTGKKSSIGEIVAKIYNISSDIIENLFVRDYIIDAILESFKKYMVKDGLLSLRLQKNGKNFHDIVENVEIEIPSWKVDKSYSFSQKEQGSVSLDSVMIKDIKGEASFKLKLYDNNVIKKKSSFSYNALNQMLDIDLATLIGIMRFELIKNLSSESDETIDFEGIDIDFSDIITEFNTLNE